THELNLIRSYRALSADVGGEAYAFFVLECASLAVRFDRDRRAIVALYAKHRHALKVGAVRATRFDAPGPKVLGDISGGETEAFGVGVAAFKLIGSQIGQPLFEVFLGDRIAAIVLCRDR